MNMRCSMPQNTCMQLTKHPVLVTLGLRYYIRLFRTIILYLNPFTSHTPIAGYTSSSFLGPMGSHICPRVHNRQNSESELECKNMTFFHSPRPPHTKM